MALLDTLGLSKRKKALRRPDLATQWTLMWWKFKQHRLAMVGMALLGLFGLCVLFAEVISPYAPGERDTKYVPDAPRMPHFFDAEGNFHLRPFVYARKAERDPVTLRMKSTVDTGKHWEIEFFVRGSPYHLFGLIPMDIHLFGTREGFIH